ncbi:FG-GAP-like repeat-containing protein [Novosphingobium sp.]|uniref:FG-GAP-like repeat-containing protein n=1 Tax=Novosphingobium sp. TaxID=1874826 RepID=UPI00261FC220|nr:FG-GAP-like repeat-containing protein [Novosphingobium sp.]
MAEIRGTNGNDTLTATTAADTIYGLAGNDIIDAFGADTVFGGDGDDRVLIGRIGTIGNFTADGGAGYDTLVVYTAAGTASPFRFDSLLQAGASVTGFEVISLQGSSANDTVYGSALSEQLVGNGGTDYLYGQGGDDDLTSYGTGYLFGGDGNDGLTYFLLNSAQAFYADGGAGSDNLALIFTSPTSFSLRDALAAGSRATSIELIYLGGSSGDDTLIGSDANEQISGGGGNDLLMGGGGNDTLNGGSVGDRLEGGDGDDELLVWFETNQNPYQLVLNGGAGNDHAFISWSVNLPLTLSVPGLVASGAVVNIETLTISGGVGNDTLTAASGFVNDLRGGDGADRIIGADGQQFLSGGSGNDWIEGLGGDDRLYGDPGDDTVFGGDGNDTIWGDSYGTGADLLYGGAGDDYVEANDGDDTLSGGDGTDTLLGGAGNDVLRVDSAALLSGEIYDGGDGIDRLILPDVGVDLSLPENRRYTSIEWLDAGRGTATLAAAQFATFATLQGKFAVADGGAINLTGKTLTNFDLTLAAGGNSVDLSGTQGAVVRGAAGADAVTGSLAADWLLGGGGADTLSGGGGNDRIEGQAGNDRLTGGAGNDTLDGGAGADTALYDTVRGAATVTRDATRALVITTSAEGADTLYGIEQLRFSDGLYSFSFARPGAAVFANFNPVNGWTSQDRTPRHLADVNGDGYTDIVGFGNAGVLVAYGSASGSYSRFALATTNFGLAAGWTSDDKAHRDLADVNGDGRADIVGFGATGTQVALARADGTFAAPTLALADFGANQGWTSQDRNPRTLADVDGDGKVDIVGFGYLGTFVALGNGDGTFQPVKMGLPLLGSIYGWNNTDFPRAVGDVNGDGKADLIWFGQGAVGVALAKGDGTFGGLTGVLENFSANQGWTDNDRFTRLVADVNGDGMADIVGFGSAGTLVAYGTSDGRFSDAGFDVIDFGRSQGWASDGIFTRQLADINGDGLPDIVGFGVAGVLVGLNQGDIVI